MAPDEMIKQFLLYQFTATRQRKKKKKGLLRCAFMKISRFFCCYAARTGQLIGSYCRQKSSERRSRTSGARHRRIQGSSRPSRPKVSCHPKLQLPFSNPVLRSINPHSGTGVGIHFIPLTLSSRFVALASPDESDKRRKETVWTSFFRSFEVLSRLFGLSRISVL